MSGKWAFVSFAVSVESVEMTWGWGLFLPPTWRVALGELLTFSKSVSSWTGRVTMSICSPNIKCLVKVHCHYDSKEVNDLTLPLFSFPLHHERNPCPHASDRCFDALQLLLPLAFFFLQWPILSHWGLCSALKPELIALTSADLAQHMLSGHQQPESGRPKAELRLQRLSLCPFKLQRSVQHSWVIHSLEASIHVEEAWAFDLSTEKKLSFKGSRSGHSSNNNQKIKF